MRNVFLFSLMLFVTLQPMGRDWGGAMSGMWVGSGVSVWKAFLKTAVVAVLFFSFNIYNLSLTSWK